MVLALEPMQIRGEIRTIVDYVVDLLKVRGVKYCRGIITSVCCGPAQDEKPKLLCFVWWMTLLSVGGQCSSYGVTLPVLYVVYPLKVGDATMWWACSGLVLQEVPTGRVPGWLILVNTC